MVNYPVISLFSFRNFRQEERKLLGWTKYSLCFIDTVMLVHFLSAAGALLETKNIHENTPKDHIRLVISLSLAAMYASIFLSFFVTCCCVKDAINLIRIRSSLLLASGFINFLCLAVIATLLMYFRGVDHPVNELAVDPQQKTDIAWIAVLVISATAVVVSMLSGVMALFFFQSFDQIDPLDMSYVGFSPESPYASFWKPSRKFPSRGDHRNGFQNLYPHRVPRSACPTPKKVSPRDSALMQELKTDLSNRKESKRTVL